MRPRTVATTTAATALGAIALGAVALFVGLQPGTATLGPGVSRSAASTGSSVPAVEYRRVPDWPRLPAGFQLGEVNGVDVDGHGHVFVFHRAERGFEPEAAGLIPDAVVLRLDADTGELLDAWGEDTFALPHGLTVDHENHVWVTDVGLHQVFKFSHDGDLLLTVGEARVGGWDERHFNRPTDVAVLPDGSFYVSDGYVNSRVASFDAAGTFRFEWGRPGAGPGEFENPHGLALSPAGELLVADRQNSRVQIFTPGGAFIREWLGAEEIGRVFSVGVGADGSIYLGIRQQDYDAFSTGVMKLDSAWVPVGHIGFGDAGDAVFSSVHDVAVGVDGALYVAETRERRISKFVPVP